MECARLVRAKGLCSMHWKRVERLAGRIPNPPWDERRKANHQKRRALTYGANAETFEPREIFDRDNWICGLCHEAINPQATYPDPSSVSLDHVLPLSCGGDHTRDNTQAAHLTCNIRKGARVAA